MLERYYTKTVLQGVFRVEKKETIQSTVFWIKCMYTENIIETVHLAVIKYIVQFKEVVQTVKKYSNPVRITVLRSSETVHSEVQLTVLRSSSQYTYRL